MTTVSSLCIYVLRDFSRENVSDVNYPKISWLIYSSFLFKIVFSITVHSLKQIISMQESFLTICGFIIITQYSGAITDVLKPLP